MGPVIIGQIHQVANPVGQFAFHPITRAAHQKDVDVVISNGGFNLSTKKDQAFAEAYRVLRPGGRMIAADMLLVADLPSTLLKNPKLWSG